MKQEILEKLGTLIAAAFALVAALAWNDAIKAIFKEVFGTPDKVIPMLVYAISVTIVAVIMTVWISKISGRLK